MVRNYTWFGKRKKAYWYDWLQDKSSEAENYGQQKLPCWSQETNRYNHFPPIEGKAAKMDQNSNYKLEIVWMIPWKEKDDVFNYQIERVSIATSAFFIWPICENNTVSYHNCRLQKTSKIERKIWLIAAVCNGCHTFCSQVWEPSECKVLLTTLHIIIKQIMVQHRYKLTGNAM